jgi:hypothetical protein
MALPSSSHLHVDHCCEILKVLKLSFHRRHRYLICECRSFIPLGKLRHHFENKHPELLRGGKAGIRTARKDFPGVVTHFSTSFGIAPDQDITMFDYESFDGPIHGIQDAELAYQCPGCGVFHRTSESVRKCKCSKPSPKHKCDSCGILHPTLDSLGKHSLINCGRTPPETYRGRLLVSALTQVPFSASQHPVRVEVRREDLDSNAATTSSTSFPEVPIQRYVVPEGTDSFCPPWLRKLGWDKWRDGQVERGMTPAQLAGFATLPPPLRKGHQFSAPLLENEIFDWVARRIHTRLKKMVEDANAWLNMSNVELRADLTAKYVSHIP